MRVLQLNIQYTGTGADRCARELYQELPKIGVESAIWAGRSSAADPPDLKILPYKWERALQPLETFPDLTDWRHRGSINKLRTVTKREFDLVHIHNIHSGWISIRAVRELTERIPCVWTLHDEWAPRFGMTYDLTGKISSKEVKRLSRGPIRYIPYHRYHENFKWRRTRPFLHTWMPQPKAVICPSLYMKSLAERSGAFPNAEILHVPNGTTLTAEPNSVMNRSEARESLGVPRGASVVLLVAADLALAHKGIDLGIKAIQTAAAVCDLHVLLLGRSSEQVVGSLKPLPITSIHAKDSATLARAYRSADVALIPSLGENFPYVALESLACETPLIAFPIGGLPEIVGANERGLMCSGISPHEMGKHLSMILADDAQRVLMGKRGRTWVQEQCGMSSYLKAVCSIYKMVLSEIETS